jgi:curved DNA-binding protein CbpA
MICQSCKNETPNGFPNCLICGKPINEKENESENEEIRYSLGARNRLKDYYQILGLEHNCTENEIKTAYKKLVVKFHPDKNEGDKFFLELFKEVQEAYEVLSDPIKRSAYDRKINEPTQTHYEQPTYREQSKPNYQPPKKRFTTGDGCFDAIIARIIGILILGAVGFIISLFDCSDDSRSRHSKRNYVPSSNTYKPKYVNEDSLNRITNSLPTPILPESKFKGNQLKTGDSPYDNYFGKGIYNKNYYNKLFRWTIFFHH